MGLLQSDKVRDRLKLRFHLAVVLVVKVALLFLLWHAFIKPNKVSVDANVLSGCLASAGSTSLIKTTSGEKQ